MTEGELVICGKKHCGRCPHIEVHEWRAPCGKPCSATGLACRPATDAEIVMDALIRAGDGRG